MTDHNTHDIHLLLPFYVNGSLDKAEQSLVEKALAEDTSLQEELNLLTQIQTEMKALPESEFSLGNAGLIRLKNSLPPAKKTDNAKKWRLSTFIASILLAVQTSFIMLSPAVYMQSGEENEHSLIITSFSPTASEAAIREILLKFDLSIVEGPSALGLYKLAAPEDPQSTAEKLKQFAIIESVHVEQ